jgi:NAD(P)H-dependent FMN reductase
MAFKPRILALAGSTRRDSYNKRLLRVAAAEAESLGAEVTLLDLRDLALPLYDGDDEAERGLPEGALRLKELMKSHHAFLIAAPEYNSSITGVLKNAIDWASRPAPNEKRLEAFDGKVAGLLSASPGALGGLRGLVTVHSILSNLNTLVIPRQAAISKAHEAFDENGALKNSHQQTIVAAVVRDLVHITTKLHG